MAKAAGEMKWDSNVARTVASPFALISSGRYSLGRRLLMTLPVSVGRERCAVQDACRSRCRGRALLSPVFRNDMVVVQVAILWHRAGHPIPRTAQDEQIKYAVVHRRPALGLPPQVEAPKPCLKFADQRGLPRVGRRTSSSAPESPARSWTQLSPNSGC